MIDLGDWKEPLAPLFADERYQKIREFLKYEYSHYIVYPDMYDLYNCFRFTPFANVKAVLLGQDPYHEPGQAHGLCFSVKEGIKKPPSLENIFKELKSDLGYDAPKSGDLTKWAHEGVLLMNTALTVREHQANSHANCGWSWFTDSVIQILSEREGTSRLSALGRQRPPQEGAHRYEETPRPRMRTSLTALRLQRLFRVQTFFKDQRLSRSQRHPPHRLGSEQLSIPSF